MNPRRIYPGTNKEMTFLDSNYTCEIIFSLIWHI
jgi:hypothetical protein